MSCCSVLFICVVSVFGVRAIVLDDLDGAAGYCIETLYCYESVVLSVAVIFCSCIKNIAIAVM